MQRRAGYQSMLHGADAPDNSAMSRVHHHPRPDSNELAKIFNERVSFSVPSENREFYAEKGGLSSDVSW